MNQRCPPGLHRPEDPRHDDARRIRDASQSLLEQGLELISSLAPGTYACRVPAAYDSSIGGHYRHCLDHFSSLVHGLDDGLVDYDRRERDPRVEVDPSFAAAVTRSLIVAVSTLDLPYLDRPVRVRCEVSYARGNSAEMASSVGRELAYAVAHGIHHYALVGVMARLLGVPLPEGFGVAPSTLAHQRGGRGA